MAAITEQEIPSEFLCPLTLQPFEYPLMSRHGMNYERSAIVEWLDLGNDSCPLTRKPLALSGLIHNKALKQKVDAWKAKNEYENTQVESRVNRAGLLVNANVQVIEKKKTPSSTGGASSNFNHQREQTVTPTRHGRRRHFWEGKRHGGVQQCWC